jgi:hypothetical protein
MEMKSRFSVGSRRCDLVRPGRYGAVDGRIRGMQYVSE